MNPLLSHMLNYQKQHNITNKCLTNVIYYWDVLEMIFPKKYKPACGILIIENMTIVHVWIVNNETEEIIECSYEYYKIDKIQKHYFTTFTEFKKIDKSDIEFKKFLLSHICELSKCMNTLISKKKSITEDYYKELKNDFKNIKPIPLVFGHFLY